jgi:hypothetical protein
MRAAVVVFFVGIAAFGTAELRGALAAQSAITAGAWITLFDGKDLSAFDQIGDANWELAEGVVQANKGNGFLVTKASYADFDLKVEFWVDADANSGVFLRCENPKQITSRNAYEVNINDKQPDPSHGTGSIPNVAPPRMVFKAGGRWNTYEIAARGSHFVVILNGTTAVDAQDATHRQGHIGLQYAAGTVKFRTVQIRPM